MSLISNILREIDAMLTRKRSSMVVRSRTNTNPSSSYFATSRQLLGFSADPSADTDPAASSTSLLDTKKFSPSVNLFFKDKKPRIKLHSAESRAVGLGIIGALRNEKPDIHRKSGNSDSPMVMFESQLKIQISSMHLTPGSTAGSTESPRSPIEFGVKNKSSRLALLSHSLSSPMAWSRDARPPTIDMELSEYYTCVIARGPNPKTTHIFDNCIVESCSTDHTYVPSQRETVFNLPFCQACNKSLCPGEVKGIFMYSDKKALSRNECRQQETLFDEGMGMHGLAHK